jgi:hypothetical protein
LLDNQFTQIAATMKGIVFSEFFELVENLFGYEMVETIISKANLPHNGIYVSGGTYPHEEMRALSAALSAETGSSEKDLLIEYGKHLFGRLLKIYPMLAEGKKTPVEFMSSIDNYIHVEVLKLYPDAELPKFDTVEVGEDFIILDYRSKRQMQPFAVGLMYGCSEFYGQKIDVRYEDIFVNGAATTRFFVKLI